MESADGGKWPVLCLRRFAPDVHLLWPLLVAKTSAPQRAAGRHAGASPPLKT